MLIGVSVRCDLGREGGYTMLGFLLGVIWEGRGVTMLGFLLGVTWEGRGGHYVEVSVRCYLGREGGYYVDTGSGNAPP